MSLFGAGADSGTFDYFTEAVVGKAKSSRGDYTASEDDNILIRGIAGDRYALGFIPYAYYAANATQMKAVPILWEGHTPQPVPPSMENVVAGKYNPLSRPLFIYVNKKSAQEKSWVREFVEFYLNNAKELVAEVKYLPLPDRAYEMDRERLGKLETGTGFGGEPAVGLPIEDILKRTPKH
jgi:phosphate transport system substrate-binding protein